LHQTKSANIQIACHLEEKQSKAMKSKVTDRIWSHIVIFGRIKEHKKTWKNTLLKKFAQIQLLEMADFWLLRSPNPWKPLLCSLPNLARSSLFPNVEFKSKKMNLLWENGKQLIEGERGHEEKSGGKD